MHYTTSLLTTKPDCEALISIAQSEKESMVFKKESLERKRQTVDITSQDIEANLEQVNEELQSLQSYYDTLPEGEVKKETLVKITKLRYKKFLLEQRKENYGVLDLLEKEFDIATIDRSVVEADDFIAQVTARLDSI